MSEITIKISAPELATAIHALAAALSQSGATQQAPMQQAPVQQSQGFQQTLPPVQSPQTVPVAGAQSYQYVTPPQQPPVQPSGMPLQGVPQQPAPQQPAQQQQPPSGVPTTAPSYTQDQLAVAATQLVDAGRRVELVNLLAQFGVGALTLLPQEQYGAFATALRQMGAKI